MSVSPQDTIVALSTPWMASGVAVIRATGPLVKEFLSSWLMCSDIKARHCYKGQFEVGGQVVDEGLWVYFPAPHSYTGEDVLELYPHGSVVILRAILKELVARGARYAREGEFTQRSFLAGKLDLSQAEAVRELIESVTLEAAAAACHTVRGAVSQRCHALEESLTQLRVLSESYLDFSDEDMVQEDFDALRVRLRIWLKEAQLFGKEAGCASKSFAKLSVAILGAPNVGKSSMMNELTKEDTSIISPTAGTTRDVVVNEVVWGSHKVRLLDTAGIRETDCEIEKEGIARIQKRLADASCILWVLESHSPTLIQDAQEALAWLSNFSLVIPVIFVLNKQDLSSSSSVPSLEGRDAVSVSCHESTGFDQLVECVLTHVEGGLGAARFYANERQVQAIEDSAKCAERALEHVSADECFAQELFMAHRHLMQVLGHFSTEDLLGDIFSKFCIGK